MSVEESIQRWMVENKKTLALAESCTGGALSARLTALPGASDYLLGSLVTYSNTWKEKFLGVQSLKTHGAVSREVAEEMLQGLLKTTGADYGIAITGIAGPAGGSKEVPVGTVWIAYGSIESVKAVKNRFLGERQAVINQSVYQSLILFFNILSKS